MGKNGSIIHIFSKKWGIYKKMVLKPKNLRKEEQHMALSMFGEFFHNVDAKGRLSVPSKFRDALGTTVVIAQGPERCLRLYSLEKWEAFVAGLEEQIDTSTVDGRQMFRKLTAKSSVCDIDSQGRIIVTPSLRDYAGITKEVAVIGNGGKAEVWDRARYEAELGDDAYSDEELANKIAEYKVQL